MNGHRQIVLDTETTGIGLESGHRIIEIGCVELIDRTLTKNRFHVYLNPERVIEEAAFRVHGISTEFLQDKPFFKDMLSEFIDFVDGAELIIHNAPFDVGFLNAEFQKAGWENPIEKHCKIFDTLVLARQKHPGQRNSLDALCKRYNINQFNRALHGALLDAEILASVYLAMTGGQISLFESDSPLKSQPNPNTQAHSPLSSQRSPVVAASPEEAARHDAFIQWLKEHSGINLWQQ